MIRLPDLAPKTATLGALAGWQGEVDSAASYAKQVSEAKRLFKLRNVTKNKIFADVKIVLERMCSGARRCVYCEDSAADEVEHVRPKDLYPEAVFRFENYVYACGPCNGPKNNRFAILPNGKTEVVDVSRARGAKVVRPAAGKPAFIDPRREDPLAIMMLDVKDTFFFVPTAAEGSRESLRARYSIEVLRLNREVLVTARRNAFDNYLARLEQFVNEKNGRNRADVLQRYAEALARESHPSVWAEMKRQANELPELAALFQKAPEARKF